MIHAYLLGKRAATYNKMYLYATRYLKSVGYKYLAIPTYKREKMDKLKPR